MISEKARVKGSSFSQKSLDFNSLKSPLSWISGSFSKMNDFQIIVDSETDISLGQEIWKVGNFASSGEVELPHG